MDLRRLTFALVVFKYAILLFFIRLMISFRQSPFYGTLHNALFRPYHAIMAMASASSSTKATAIAKLVTAPVLTTIVWDWLRCSVQSIDKLDERDEAKGEQSVSENAESLLTKYRRRNDDGFYAYDTYNTFISPL